MATSSQAETTPLSSRSHDRWQSLRLALILPGWLIGNGAVGIVGYWLLGRLDLLVQSLDSWSGQTACPALLLCFYLVVWLNTLVGSYCYLKRFLDHEPLEDMQRQWFLGTVLSSLLMMLLLGLINNVLQIVSFRNQPLIFDIQLICLNSCLILGYTGLMFPVATIFLHFGQPKSRVNSTSYFA